MSVPQTTPVPLPPPLPSILGFALGPFETNCYLLRNAAAAPNTPASKDCWLIDVSFNPDALLGEIKHLQLTPRAIILTHAHVDHIAGIPHIQRAFPNTPVWIHDAEAQWLHDPERNLSAAFGQPISLPQPTRLLHHRETLALGDMTWRVLHTPGHSPGSITLVHDAPNANPAPTIAFVGDTLFHRSIGRTDFPGSSFDQLAHSIRTHLYTLPPNTLCYPGHGPMTTIADEQRHNPFVKA